MNNTYCSSVGPYRVVAPYLDYRAGLWMAIGTATVGEVTVTTTTEDGEESEVLPAAQMDMASAALAHGPCLGVEIVPNPDEGSLLLDVSVMYLPGPWVEGWSLQLGAGWRM